MELLQETGEFTRREYEEAIAFALNYPPEIHNWKYQHGKDIFKVLLFDAGWYTIKLEGKFVRSCLKWQGIKKWRPDNEKPRLQDNSD